MIAFDQLEQNRLEKWEDRLRHIIGRGALFAETLPSLSVIFAVLPALYDTIAQEIDRSIRDRIEKFGTLPVSLKNLSRPQVAMLLEQRLGLLYYRCGVQGQPADPLYPFEEWFVDELSAQTPRYVTDMVQTFRRLLIDLGRMPGMDDFPSPETVQSTAPAGGYSGASQAYTGPAIDFGEIWERYLVQTLAPPTPTHALSQADAIEWGIHAAEIELDDVKAVRTRKTMRRGRADTLVIELEIEAKDGNIERRDIALCNEGNEGATLSDEIASFLATCRNSRPVIVRPRGRPLPKSGRGVGAVLREAEDAGAIIIRQFDKPSWEKLQIAKNFFLSKDMPGFLDWQRDARPLTQIPPLAQILQYPYVKQETKAERAERTAGEAATAAAPEPAGLHVPTGAHIMLGDAPTGEVCWAPFETQNRLLNFGLLVTGDPGSGKTQTLNVLIDGVVRMGFPVCIFDFKNDYVSREFVTEQGLRVHDVRRDGLPFNPLLPSADRDGRAKPIEHIFTISGVLKRVFELGDQQEARLRDAMKQAFERSGVDTQAWVNVDTLRVPAFDDVVTVLREYEGAARSHGAQPAEPPQPAVRTGPVPAPGEPRGVVRDHAGRAAGAVAVRSAVERNQVGAGRADHHPAARLPGARRPSAQADAPLGAGRGVARGRQLASGEPGARRPGVRRRAGDWHAISGRFAGGFVGRAGDQDFPEEPAAGSQEVCRAGAVRRDVGRGGA